MTRHEDWSDAVGAYLLGALPPDEREGFEAHLAECATCRRDVAELGVAADALPIGVPQVAPPPALKDRIMREVRAEAQLLAAAGSEADRPPRPARRTGWLSWLGRPAVALACALALLAAGAAGGILLADGDEDTRTVAAQTTAAGADVRLEIGDDDATLVVRDLPPPPDGRIYQVWLQRAGGAPEPTDVLWSVDAEGSAEVRVPGPLDGVEAVLVTDEPPGGATTPSKTPIITASPA